MDGALIDRLCLASESKTFSPEKDVPWGIPFDQREPPALPDHLLSLYGTTEFSTLSSQQRRTLARHEVASFFSTFVRFEGVLNENLARAIRKTDPADPLVRYYLHVVEEEARHSRMFVRLVDATGAGSYPMRGLLGAVESNVSGCLRLSFPLFLLAMLGVEEITDRIFALMLRADLHPTVREVCRIHRIEEARHMEFARSVFLEAYEHASAFERLAVRTATPIVLALIFDLLVTPQAYLRAGVVDSRSAARRLWLKSRRSPERRNLRHDSVLRISKHLAAAGVLNSRTRHLWAAADLVT